MPVTTVVNGFLVVGIEVVWVGMWIGGSIEITNGIDIVEIDVDFVLGIAALGVAPGVVVMVGVILLSLVILIVVVMVAVVLVMPVSMGRMMMAVVATRGDNAILLLLLGSLDIEHYLLQCLMSVS